MSLSRAHTWAVGDVLGASDLNGEFNNILNYLNASPILAVDSLTLATNDLLQWSGSAWANKTIAQVAGAVQGYISGLTLSAAGATATFGIAAGVCADSTAVSGLSLASAYTKTGSNWAVGTGNGGLDTGSIANSTWYHVYAIKRVDTGVVDVIFSASAASPTLPANYTLFRYIGSMKTDGSAQWVKFSQRGDEFLWAVPVRDINTAVLDTTPLLSVLSVPTGIQVNALIRGDANHASAGTAVLLNSPDETSAAPSAGNYTAITQVNSQAIVFRDNIRTDTSGRIRSVSAAASTTLEVSTFGWIDTRGRG